jgi:hypothetical protein
LHAVKVSGMSLWRRIRYAPFEMRQSKVTKIAIRNVSAMAP